MTKLRAASMFVLVSLLALVFAIGMAVSAKLEIPSQFALPFGMGFAVIIVTLQYIIGPFLLDSILQVRWTSAQELGPEFSAWQQRTCKTFKIAEPRLGIIEDGRPNAFTYGHTAGDGRVIISRGLIDILDPEELKAVYGHELGHIKNRDFIIMTIVQALVLVLYVFARGSRFSRNRNFFLVALASYAAYWVSYYISLLFSRIREYMADYASAQILGNPNALCSALVKISYGLAQTHATKPGPNGMPHPVPPPRMPTPVPSYGSPASVPPGYGNPAAQPSPAMGAYGAASTPYATPFASAQNPDTAMIIAASFQKPVDPRVAAKQQKQRDATLQSLGAFGIANAASMRAAVAWYQPGANTPSNFAKAARWELYNPWARIAELFSTHPITAFRIRALQKLNRVFGQPDLFDFSQIQPAKYGGFVRDLIIVVLPLVGLGGGALASWLLFKHSPLALRVAFPIQAGLAGGLVKLIVSYAVGHGGRRKVLGLLSDVDVSHVHPEYVTVEGVLTGRLESGIPWAKDFILQDDTGFVACIYRQPSFIWEAIFGFFVARELVGRPVLVSGWYRRFNSPYLEIDKMQMLDTKETRRAWHFPWLVFLYLVGIGLTSLLFLLK